MLVEELIVALQSMNQKAQVMFDTEAALFNVHCVPIDSAHDESEALRAMAMEDAVILHTRDPRDYGAIPEAEATTLRAKVEATEREIERLKKLLAMDAHWAADASKRLRVVVPYSDKEPEHPLTDLADDVDGALASIFDTYDHKAVRGYDEMRERCAVLDLAAASATHQLGTLAGERDAAAARALAAESKLAEAAGEIELTWKVCGVTPEQRAENDDPDVETLSQTVYWALQHERDKNETAVRERDEAHHRLNFADGSLQDAGVAVEHERFDLAIEKLAADRDIAIAAKIESDKACAGMRAALEFYADPETYFAIGFMPDRPCGEFMEDFEDVEHDDGGKWFKPGKRARAVLNSPVDPVTEALQKMHEVLTEIVEQQECEHKNAMHGLGELNTYSRCDDCGAIFNDRRARYESKHRAALTRLAQLVTR